MSSRSVTGLSPKIERPDIVTDAMLEYLDDLRDSGVTNMYGAGEYLEHTFSELNRKNSHEVLQYWMKTFSDRNRTKVSV